MIIVDFDKLLGVQIEEEYVAIRVTDAQELAVWWDTKFRQGVRDK